MPTALITGANRGLGLEFVRQYAGEGWRVLACCREPGRATALAELADGSGGKVSVHRVDVADRGSVDLLARELAGTAIDLLLNNAGTFGDRKGLGELDYDTWLATLAVNTLGPVKMTEAFREHVAASDAKLVVQITSKMGSIADNTSGGGYVYRSSKAALNMANKSLALDLVPQGITCVVLHPGWVVTDMGGPSAPLQPAESVGGMRKVIARLTTADAGRFFDYAGAEIPW